MFARPTPRVSICAHTPLPFWRWRPFIVPGLVAKIMPSSAVSAKNITALYGAAPEPSPAKAKTAKLSPAQTPRIAAICSSRVTCPPVSRAARACKTAAAPRSWRAWRGPLRLGLPIPEEDRCACLRRIRGLIGATPQSGETLPKSLVITEKPSVARDIVAVLGGFTEHDGFWESDDYVVTFSVGHIVELISPEDVDPIYKRWTLDTLPILPAEFKLKQKQGQSERIRAIKKLLARKDIDIVVNACDAGREGELIFREILEFLESDKPTKRLWLQSMTADSIRSGFGALVDGHQYDGLGAAASCRSKSDWLIGMNATRALTRRLKGRKEKTAWSAGRVQTPTLAIVVDRELEVLAHVPRPYWQLQAKFLAGDLEYLATWFDPSFTAPEGEEREQRDDRIFESEKANQLLEL